MLIIIFILAFASCFILVYSILAYIQRGKLSVASRLDGIRKMNITEVNTELSQPLFSRVLRPMLDNMGKAMMRVTPGEMLTNLEKKIVKAGNPANMEAKDWLSIQALMIVGLPVLTLIIGRSSNMSAGNLLMFIIAEVALGFVLPGFILGKLLTARQKIILNSLPDVIDLLTVSVEAGLGFDGALLKVVDKKPGPLASEFDKVLQEIKVGRQKKDALKDMAERVDLQDFTAFVGAVVQADQFGVGIANVLKIQAEQMRQKRRQRAQEKAMKAPVKMLIPMVLFIFPTLFIVLLGPVAIQLIEQFSK
ncbi:MAG: type II secretion system F family protein [Clostridiaceae bacterium]